MGMKNTFSAYIVTSIIKVILTGLLILLVNAGLVVGGIHQHVLLPANEPIKKAEKIKNIVIQAESIDTRMIPPELDYAIFDKQTKKMVKSNLSQRKEEKAKAAFRQPSTGKLDSFIKYDSKQQSLLIYYNLKVQFANAELRKAVPDPGVWLFVLSILTYCLYIIWRIRRFSQVIITENQKLISVASKIKEKDLTIAFPHVRFNEYKDVMGAMESLSAALVESIQKEIKASNTKAEQISYLVHDIKIPLTVIKGNTELLEAAAADDDMKESVHDILNAIHQVEQYIQEVIDLNLNNKQMNTKMEEVLLTEFVSKLETDGKSLGNPIIIENDTDRGTAMFIDESLLLRAIGNIILNGIERTPAHEHVRVVVRRDQDFIQFIITDQGSGFSKEAISKGTELFFTENDGRTNNSHYGLGLTFTESVIKQHHGRMQLRNNAQHSGEVLVELPVLKRG